MRPPRTALGPGGEFDRIRAIWRRLGDHADALGDDAALVTVGGEPLALSCDLAVEGRHFRLAWLEPQEIGWRAGAAALSDLAAVAAEPAGVLAAVGVPAGREGAFLEELMGGIADAAASVGAVIWGGDLVRADAVTVDVVVVGRAPRPLRRAGARAGDGLWVTGRLGAPHEAVAAWERGEAPAPALRARYAHPVPRVREAAWLRDRGATAMLDVSDGLVGDAGHLAAASQVALLVEAERVPAHPAVTAGSRAPLVGGEEYELLATMPDAFGDDEAAEFRRRFDLPLTRVGAVGTGAGVTVQRAGRPVDVGGSYSHF